MVEGRRLRVAAVMDTFAVSGPGRQIAALAAALKAQNVDLKMFMFQRQDRPRPPFFDYLDAAGVPFHASPERRTFDLAAFRAFKSAITAWQPDIVQSHHYKPTAFVLALRLMGHRWPWIGFFHGETRENTKMLIYNAVHERMLPWADRVVVLAKEHEARFSSVSQKVRLVHNAVLTLPTSGTSLDLSTYRQGNLPLIGALARLSHEKGVDLLVEAVAKRHAAGAPLVLVVAGTGPERANLEAQAARLGIGSFVHFVGFVADVVPLYKQLDAVVLPSREGSEGMPNVLLESLNAGTPVVATAVAAVPEVLTDGISGILTPPGDSEAMATAIARALETGRSEAALCARAQTADRFSLARRVETHLSMYRELVPWFASSQA